MGVARVMALVRTVRCTRKATLGCGQSQGYNKTREEHQEREPTDGRIMAWRCFKGVRDVSIVMGVHTSTREAVVDGEIDILSKLGLSDRGSR